MWEAFSVRSPGPFFRSGPNSKSIRLGPNDTYRPLNDTHRQQSNARMAKRADILERFGARVRELRKEQGYSQEGFAAACGLDRTYIGGIERGERNLALRNLDVIAQTLGITLSELMEGL